MNNNKEVKGTIEQVKSIIGEKLESLENDNQYFPHAERNAITRNNGKKEGVVIRDFTVDDSIVEFLKLKPIADFSNFKPSPMPTPEQFNKTLMGIREQSTELASDNKNKPQ